VSTPVESAALRELNPAPQSAYHQRFGVFMLDFSSHDVLLVGGGGAGLRAAIAVAETNPNLNVAVVSKVYPMRSHTVAAEGGAAAVHLEEDSLDEHAYDTISGGDWLCDQDAVEAFVKEAQPRQRVVRGNWSLTEH
jgi:fumarate reductase flavoprotein subunit